MVLLAGWGLRPALRLTLDPKENASLLGWIEKINKTYRLNVVNLCHQNLNKQNYLYETSKALIYPSLIESFGLPLLEAKAFGLRILASEKDYVRDVVAPDETFDPYSANSIALAIMRDLGVDVQSNEPRYVGDFCFDW